LSRHSYFTDHFWVTSDVVFADDFWVSSDTVFAHDFWVMRDLVFIEDSMCKHPKRKKKKERSKAEMTPPSFSIAESAATQFLAADFRIGSDTVSRC